MKKFALFISLALVSVFGMSFANAGNDSKESNQNEALTENKCGYECTAKVINVQPGPKGKIKVTVSVWMPTGISYVKVKVYPKEKIKNLIIDGAKYLECNSLGMGYGDDCLSVEFSCTDLSLTRACREYDFDCKVVLER